MLASFAPQDDASSVEIFMTTNQNQHDSKANPAPNKNDTALERLAKHVDPPGREVSDEDLKNPGQMTPGAPPVDNRS
jgi:hypothetical protein